MDGLCDTEHSGRQLLSSPLLTGLGGKSWWILPYDCYPYAKDLALGLLPFSFREAQNTTFNTPLPSKFEFLGSRNPKEPGVLADKMSSGCANSIEMQHRQTSVQEFKDKAAPPLAQMFPSW